jgi:hypothetical protein
MIHSKKMFVALLFLRSTYVYHNMRINYPDVYGNMYGILAKIVRN